MKPVRAYADNPKWRRQHRWRTAVWKGLASLGLTGWHGLPVSRQWVEIHRRKMPMKRLDPAFEKFRIVQMSDLHYSPMVWKRYLQQFVHWVNDFQPDLVVVTGDLVTGGQFWSTRVAHILKQIKATHGVVCTLGNHDYSMFGKRMPRHGMNRADHLADALRDAGLIVLRNEVLRIRHNDCVTPLTIVGLDDEWSGAIDADKGFAGVSEGEPVICLNHNPANALELMHYPWQWMLSGHTHGRQLTGRMRREYTFGYYPLGDRHLYVNRGLSYGQRRKRWCRPEISIFRLRCDADVHNPAIDPAFDGQPLPVDACLTPTEG
ncbi:MAG TPA: metallophosphoesterase [Tepidisphaeraceae bacterium]